MTWKQLRGNYYGTGRIAENGIVLYNPAKMQVTRYRFRGQQICTPYNIDEVDPAGTRQTDHEDGAFTGRLFEQLELHPT